MRVVKLRPRVAGILLLLLSMMLQLAGPMGSSEVGAEPGDSFVLGAGDELEIEVWGYPEFSAEAAVVLPDGTLPFPFVGPLQAAGLSVRELADSYAQALEPHIEAPLVNLRLVQMRSRHFSVLGAVKEPGLFPLWGEEVPLLEAVAQAGGLTAEAMADQARLFRSGRPEGLVVRLGRLLGGSSQESMPRMLPGDVVFIPSRLDAKTGTAEGPSDLGPNPAGERVP